MAPSRKRKSKNKLDPNVPKWKFLEHNGPMFPCPNPERLPSNARMLYNGKPLDLSEKAEEMAILYGQIQDPETTRSVIFKRNFFEDWCLQMNDEERELITNLDKCDFTAVEAYCRMMRTKKNRLPKEARMYPKPDAEVAVYLKEKAQRDDLIEKHGYATVDGVRVPLVGFEIGPAKLFLGKNDSPKLGLLRKPMEPEDIIVNCSHDSKFPEPPPGHAWKEIRHDRTKLWLAYWRDPVADRDKFAMLEPAYQPKKYPVDVVDKLKSEDNDCDNSSEAQSDDLSESNLSAIQESPLVTADDEELAGDVDDSTSQPSNHDSVKRAKITDLPDSCEGGEMTGNPSASPQVANGTTAALVEG